MLDVINDPSILEEVLGEAFELRQDLEQCLLVLETNPEDLDCVHRAFRCVHSIKGNCGMLGLDAISEFTHELESVLDRLRKEEIEFTRTTCDLLLAGTDVLGGLLASIRDKQPVPAERDQVLIRLREFLAVVAQKSSVPAEPVQRIEDKVAQELDDLNAECLKECLDESFENLELMEQELCVLENDSANQQSLGNVFRTIHTIAGMSGCFNLGKLRKLASAGESLLDQMRDGSRRVDSESLRALRTLAEALHDILDCVQKTGNEGTGNYDQLRERLQALEQPATNNPQPENLRTEQSAPTSLVSESVASRPVENNIRVNVQLLDKLMNLVRELVLTRNQFSTLASSLSDPTFLRTAQRLNLSTAELQEVVMKIRMQPIGNIWNSFSRLVRDLTLALGKQVRIEMEGIDTELDRTIIEAVRDPLTHLVRNALDHGFETPDVRRRCGKPAEGRLFLRAYHDGGYVNIEISDDGAGPTPTSKSARLCQDVTVQRIEPTMVCRAGGVWRGGDRAVWLPVGVCKGADRRVGHGGRVGTSKRTSRRLGIVVSTSQRASVCHARPFRIDAHSSVCLCRPFRINGHLSVCLCGPFRIDGHLSVCLCRRVWRGKCAGFHRSGPFRIGKRLGWRLSGPKVHGNRLVFTSF